MIINIKGRQDCGKTSTMVAAFLSLCLNFGYTPEEAVGNLTVNVPGYKKLTNEKLRDFIKNMITKNYRHRIVLMDEADGVYPARFWHKQSQTDDLLGFWQDFKLFNYVLMTTHPGRGVDLMLRESTRIEVIPKYVKADDAIYLTILNDIDLAIIRNKIYPASKLFQFYKRWEPVK